MSVIEAIAVTGCRYNDHDIMTDHDDWDPHGEHTHYVTCFTCGVTWERYNGAWQIIDGGASRDSW